MKLILLGAPGAGKGTQAEVICDKLSIPTISTGNIIREALKNETEMGLKAKSFIESGKLVPDEVIIGIIKQRLVEKDCENGFILDGVPRTLAQAKALDEMGVEVDKVLDIEVGDEVITQRMSGRRVCSACGASYHVEFKPSKTANVCDRCNGELMIRKDDEPATVMDRLSVYHELTEPLIEYYENQGKLVVVQGVGSVDEISQNVFKALEV